MPKTAVPIHPDVEKFLLEQELVTIGFSGGRDSVATCLVLKELGVPFIPFFMFQCPDLKFIDDYIAMYEKILGVEVVRFPHPMLYDYIRHQDFQYPWGIEALNEYEWPKFTFQELARLHLNYIGYDGPTPYDAAGVRAAESFNRRMVFKKYGFFRHDERKVFPICDWKREDVMRCLNAHNVPLTGDYAIWDRSYDGMKYQFLYGVRDHYPEDYERIKDLFPLIDIELLRYEINQTYFK